MMATHVWRTCGFGAGLAAVILAACSTPAATTGNNPPTTSDASITSVRVLGAVFIDEGLGAAPGLQPQLAGAASSENIVITVSGGNDRQQTLADAAGNFAVTVSPGTYSFVAEQVQPDGSMKSGLATVEATGVSELRLTDPIRIRAAGAVYGLVTLADSEDWRGIAVAIQGSEIFALSDEYGSYAIPAVPEGNHTVKISKFGYKDVLIEGVQVTAGQAIGLEDVQLNADPGVLQSAGKLSGKVTSGGAGLGGVLIAVKGLGASTVTAQDGSYALALPAGDFTILAVAQGYELVEKDVSITVGQNATADFNLSLAAGTGQGRIVGRVVDAESRAGVANVQLLANPLRGQALSAVDGGFDLALPEGCYNISVRHGDYVPTTLFACVAPSLEIEIGTLGLYASGGLVGSWCVESDEICDDSDNDCDGKVDEVCDKTPPDTFIQSRPASVANAVDSTFGFFANEPSVFECRLDGGLWQLCGSPIGFGDIVEGAHVFEVRASDAAWNTDPTPVTAAWTVDRTPPAAFVSVAGGAFWTNSPSVNLALAVTGASEMLLAQNAAFAGAAWAPATTTIDLFLMGGDGAKTLYFKTRDAAGNQSGVALASIQLDSAAPNGLSMSAPSVVSSATVALALTASDAQSAIEVQISEQPDFSDAVWQAYAANVTYSFANASDGEKTLYARFRDQAGNVSAALSRAILLDTLAPENPALTIAGGAYSQSPLLTLNLSAGGAAEVQLSQASDFSGAVWQPFALSKSFALTGGDGLKTVYARFRDQAGNRSAVISASVTLDSSNPSAPGVVLAGGAGVSAARDVAVAINLPSGDEVDMQLSENSGFAAAVWAPVTTATVFSFSSGDGLKTLFVRTRDASGRNSSAGQDSLVVDSTGPLLTGVQLNAGAAATHSTEVQVALNSDGSAAEMELSDDNGVLYARGAFAANTTVTLSAGQGLRTLTAKLWDAVGNASSSAFDSIVVDQTAPSGSVQIAGGAAYATALTVSLNLSASDNFGFAAIQLAHSLAALATTTAATFEATKLWTLVAGDGLKQVWYRVIDNAGNAGAAVSDTIMLDTQAPQPGFQPVQINADAASGNNRTVLLSLDVSGARQMRLSESPSLADAAWEPFAANVQRTLSVGDGVKTVYAMFRDDAGNQTAIYNDTILLDTTQPAAASFSVVGNTVTTPVLTLALAANDASGLITAQIDENLAFTSPTEVTFASGSVQIGYTLNDGSQGLHLVYARFCDAAGNCVGPFSDQVELDSVPPGSPQLGIRDGLYSNDLLLTLDLFASGADLMAIQVDDSDFGAAVYEAFNTVQSLLLTVGEGPRTVWAMFKDHAGHTAGPVSDMVIVDTVAPVAGPAPIELSQGASLTADRVIDVELAVSEASEFRLSESASFAGAFWQAISSNVAFTLSSGDGVKRIWVEYRDAADNRAGPFFDEIALDQAAPSGAAFNIVESVSASATLTLNLSANDAAGLVTAQISENLNFDEAQSLTFASGAFVTQYTLGDNAAGVHFVYARYCDAAGNCAGPFSDYIVLDAVPPSGSVIIAGGNDYATSSQVSLSLTAFDAGSGVQQIKLANSLAGLATTIATSFDATKIWTLAAGQGLRSVWCQAIDGAGNAGLAVSDSIVIDSVAPSAGSISINGGAVATAAPSVNVALSWLDASEILLAQNAAFAGAAWTLYAVNVPLYLTGGDGEKILYLKARDAAGNQSVVVTDSIVLDTAPPQATGIAFQQTAISNTTAALHLSALDAATVTLAENSALSLNPQSFAFVATTNYTLSSGSDGLRAIYSRFCDALGNCSAVQNAVTLLDRTPPSGSLRINGDAAYAATNMVVLNLTASDNLGLASIRLANSQAELASTTATNFEASKIWTLPVGQGLRAVWYQLFDNAGNASLAISDTVVIDSQAPMPGLPALTLASGADITNQVSVVAQLVATDASEMQLSQDSGFAGAAWVAYAPSANVVLSGADGLKTVYARFRDLAGNTTLGSSASLTLDRQAPSGLALTGPSESSSATLLLGLAANDLNGPVEALLADGVDFAGATWRPLQAVTAFTLSNGLDGAKTIYAQYRDRAGNVSQRLEHTFVLDTLAPQAAAISVQDGAYTQTQNVSLLLLATGASEVLLSEDSAFGGAVWQPYLPFKTFTLAAGEGAHTIYAKFRDAANNVAGPVSATVRLDTQNPPPPAVSIAGGVATTAARAITVALAFGGGDETEMQLSESSGFGGAAWVAVTSQIVYQLSGGDGAKTLFVRSRDASGRISSNGQDSIDLDQTGPSTPTLDLDGGNVLTNDLIIDVALGNQGDAAQMILADDAAFSGAVWQSFAANVTYTLPSGDGVKTVFAKTRDAVGNESAVVGRSIVLDTGAPGSPQLSIAAGASHTQTSLVLLSLFSESAADMRLSENANFAGAAWQTYSTSFAFALTGGEGSRTVYAEFRDAALNTAGPVSDSIAYDASAPLGHSLTINNGALTNSRVLSLDIDFADAAEMQLSIDPAFGGAVWQPVTLFTDLYLGGADGLYTVYLRVRDAAGNVAATVTDAVVLDTTPPEFVSLQLNSGAQYANSLTLSVTVTANGAPNKIDIYDAQAETLIHASPFVTNITVTLAGDLDGNRSVRVLLRDEANNWSASAQDSIWIDRQAPTASLAINGGAARTVTNSIALNLFAADSGSAIRGVKLADSFVGLASASEVAYEATKVWTLANFVENGEALRQVWLQALDLAGNASTAVSDMIVLDTLAPSGALAFATTLTRDTLIGLDLTYSGDVESMKLSSGDSCAGGSWIGATSATLWNLDGVDGQQWASVRFRDGVGNESPCYAASATLDTTGPAVTSFYYTANAGADSGYTGQRTLQLHASHNDPSGCAHAAIDETLGFYEPNQTVACGAFPYAYDLASAASGVYTVGLRFVDALGNAGPMTAFTVIADYEPPSGSLALSPAQMVNNSNVTLSLAASNAHYMQVATSTVCSGAYIGFANNHPLTLVGADGEKDVAVRYKSKAGLVSSCYSSVFTLDTSIGSGWSLQVTGFEGRNDLTAKVGVTIALSGVDSDVGEVKISNLPTFGDANWTDFAAALPWILTSGDGNKDVYVKIRDKAGNESQKSVAIILDQTAPDAPVLQLIDINGDGFALSSSDVELQWTLPTGADLFDLQRMIVGVNADFAAIATLAQPTNSHVDSITAPGSICRYRIRASDEIGNTSSWSNFAEASPFEPLDAVYWTLDSEAGLGYSFTPNSATFSMLTNHYWQNADGIESFESLFQNQTFWIRSAASTDLLNEFFTVKTANQDNSLVYESDFPLGLDIAARLDYLYESGSSSSVYADAFGNVYVAYVHSTDNAIKIATIENEDSWSIETAVTFAPGETISNLKLIADLTGQLHLSYQALAFPNTSFQYALRDTAGMWAAMPYAFSANPNVDSDMAVVADGTVYLTYSDGPNFRLLEGALGAFSEVTVPSAGAGMREDVAIVLDEGDRPHLAYRSSTPPSSTLFYLSQRNFVDRFSTALNGNPFWQGGSTASTGTTTGEPSSPYALNIDRNNAVAGGVGDSLTSIGLRPFNTSRSYSYYWKRGAAPNDPPEAADELRFQYSTNGTTWTTVQSHFGGVANNYTLVTGLLPTDAIAVRFTMIAAGADAPNSDDFFVDDFSISNVWAPELVVQETTNGNQVGQLLKLALDQDNQPALVYLHRLQASGIGNRIRNAYRNASGGWNFSTMHQCSAAPIDTECGAGLDATIDRAGRYQATFSSGVIQGGLLWLTGITGMFNPVTLVETHSVSQTAIMVDHNLNSYISYNDSTDQDLWFQRRVNLVAASPIRTVGDLGAYTSLALDSNGTPHIAYGGLESGGDLYWSRLKGSVWVEETIEAGAGKYTSLALDANDNAYLAYGTYAGNAVRFADRVTGAWNANNVTTGTGLTDVNLVLQSGVTAYVSYRNGSGVLFYSYGGPIAWNAVIVDSGNVGAGNDIAVEQNGTVHLTYYDAANADLKYAACSADICNKVVLDVEGDAGQYNSIVTDPADGSVHIAYYHASHKGLAYITNKSGSWLRSFINLQGVDTGKYPSLVLYDGALYVTYLETGNGTSNDRLWFSTNVSGSWINSRIAFGGVGRYNSLAIDKLGKGHVSYWMIGGNDLGYATQFNGTLLPASIGLVTPFD